METNDSQQPHSPLIPASWQLPQEFRDRLGSRPGRQRAMFADGHLLLVLHAPPKPDDDEREGRIFWRDPPGSWHSNQQGTGTAALERHLNEYRVKLDQLESDEARATSSEDYFDVIEHLAPLHRATRNLHQVLQNARKLCPADRRLIDWRDRAYMIERTAELLFAGAKAALDFAVARRAEEQAAISQRLAASAHRLNVLVAFFFPLATLTALFGTNLKSGLESADAPWALLALTLIGLAIGSLLTRFVGKA